VRKGPGLAEGLAALAPKLTEVHAQKAIAPLLQQIRRTTNPGAFVPLADGLGALAPSRNTA
jgi:hypothetical protein